MMHAVPSIDGVCLCTFFLLCKNSRDFRLSCGLVMCLGIVNSVPDSFEEDLARTPFVLRSLIAQAQFGQLLLNARWTLSTLQKMIVNVAIRIGQCEAIHRCGKVPTKPCLAIAVLALHPGKTNLVGLNFGSAARAIFFCKVANLHLLHQQIEIVCD